MNQFIFQNCLNLRKKAKKKNASTNTFLTCVNNIYFRPHVKSLKQKVWNANLATSMDKFLVFGAKLAFAMTMFAVKAWNMKKINPFLVLNVDMKLPRQRNYQCQPDRINSAGNNLEVLAEKMMILVHITHGKVSLDYLPKYAYISKLMHLKLVYLYIY